MTDEQQVDLAKLANTLQCLLAQHGFTEEPISGCSTGIGGSSNPAEVANIVQAVVAELKKRGLA
jgi:4-hydroxy-tetrahydrodipicolinate synthase